ncbi:hypothetical protein [Chamaesiphon sp.]|uniref:hypothetical protein n=1 Tax=Chamaesiphon sp. TaxID=2814140 RepID=UPI0035936003
MNGLAALLDDLDIETTAEGRNLLNLQILLSVKEPILPSHPVKTSNLARLCDEILTFLESDVANRTKNN